MSWRESIWLWGLGALPLLGVGWWWLFRWRRRAGLRFAAAARLSALRVGASPGLLEGLRAAIWLTAVGALLIALAGPRWGRSVRKLRSRGVDVVLLLDVSASMRAGDVRPNRFERARAELLALLPRLTGHRVGAVAFAADTLEFPLTVDGRALELFLQDLSPEEVPVQGTDLGGALWAAARMLRRIRAAAGGGGLAVSGPVRSLRSSAVLLVTDGEDHEGRIQEGARALRDVGAHLHVAVFAGREPVRVPALDARGRRVGWVREAGGKLARSGFTASEEQRLREALAPFGASVSWSRWGEGPPMGGFLKSLSRLKQRELRERTVVRWGERFVWPLGVVVILLLAEAWLPRARRRAEVGA